MDLATAVVFVYSLFCLFGGVLGYVKAKSKASLIAGLVSGVLLSISAYGIAQGYRVAYFVSLIISFLLGARFLKTWFKNHRIMPDLIMLILSLATLIAVGFSAFSG